MTELLSDLLRRTAEATPAPVIDVDELVARAAGRQRRRQLTAVGVAALVLGAVVAGGAVAGRGSDDIDPAPSPSPTPVPGSRPLVYAEGATVHIGDRTVEAPEPVAFIDVTDDGVVFEAALDGRLWFSDGETVTRIGTSPWTAAPTAHAGVVMTGDSGSLVVWPDDGEGHPDQEADRFVVYDTSRREVVAHIPFPAGGDGILLYVDEERVYYTTQLGPGCWVAAVDACDHPHLLRFDVLTGATRRIGLDDWSRELGTHPRMFVAVMPDRVAYVQPYHPGATFRQVDGRLVHTDPAPLTTSSGDQVRLRLPDGYTVLGLKTGASGIAVSQWLAENQVAVFADDGGGDLPAKEGDLLVCELPDGRCRVAVPRSTQPYVVPWRASE